MTAHAMVRLSKLSVRSYRTWMIQNAVSDAVRIFRKGSDASQMRLEYIVTSGV
jgi:hypothetical protein